MLWSAANMAPHIGKPSCIIQILKLCNCPMIPPFLLNFRATFSFIIAHMFALCQYLIEYLFVILFFYIYHITLVINLNIAFTNAAIHWQITAKLALIKSIGTVHHREAKAVCVINKCLQPQFLFCATTKKSHHYSRDKLFEKYFLNISWYVLHSKSPGTLPLHRQTQPYT